MKKLIIGGAAIAVLGYLGVVGYLHQFDKENGDPTFNGKSLCWRTRKSGKSLI